MAFYPGPPGWAGTWKVKPISGFHWRKRWWVAVASAGLHVQVCTLLRTDNHTSTPPLSFLQAGCPSCHPTNSVKALKANNTTGNWRLLIGTVFSHLIFKKQNRKIPHRFSSFTCFQREPLRIIGIDFCGPDAFRSVPSVKAAGLSGLVVSTSDCGVKGLRFESRSGWLCLLQWPLRYAALGLGWGTDSPGEGQFRTSPSLL